ncbi:MAG: shikimate kinase [Oscillospiraceae bacterium]|nr:shikimate kinase [Oscillospiraceae bacterium]
MKLLFLFGDGAVGKMTVGQELCKITDFRLFHNHMTIEPVLDVFGYFSYQTIKKIRDIIFEDFAASDNYGMIFTFMFAFDSPYDWECLEETKKIFEPYNTEFYYAELVAPLEIRLERNKTPNRLENKPSKRDLETSEQRLLRDDEKHRFVSFEGEIPFENYIKIDNSNLSAAETAKIIKERFSL